MKKNTKPNANIVGAGLVPTRDHKGITLIALIITIIVMLILVGVSITIALKGGLFETTKKAAKGTEAEKNAEQELANGRVKIDGVWYDSIEDYVGGKQSDNQTEPEKPVEPEKPDEPVTPPEEPVVKPEVGDYVNYEPDVVSTSYLVEGKYSGYGDYDTSSYPYTLTTANDQTIVQEKLEWQILKIHENGSIDLIGTPKTGIVRFSGSLGYNNGVYLMHDICKTLYSKPSQGIEARSVSLEDFEDEGNGGNWKAIRDESAIEGVQYSKTKEYTNTRYTYYPNLYAQENGAGINTTVVKTDGIKSTDKGYDSLTEETSSNASNRLTATQTLYEIVINETNYGKSAKVLSYSSYWVASRWTNCGINGSDYGLFRANTSLRGGYVFSSDGSSNASSGSLRPIVTLKSSAELKLSAEGVDGEPNTFEITKY